MVGKPSELGGIYFKTQKERDEYIRKVLKNGERVLEGQELAVIHDLLLLHSDADAKIGRGVKQIEVKKSRQGFDYCFWVVRRDLSIDDFSYDKCKYSRNKLIECRRKSAYRAAIQEQIIDYRFVQRKSNQYCDICGSQEDIEVDHFQPRFIELVRDFEIGKSDVPVEFEEAEGTLYSKRFCEGDEGYRSAWQMYHKRHGVLRLLCKNDNLGRKRNLE